jgi:hypothetical protein
MDSLYEELNQISNDEFDTILKKSPIQDYLGVSFENHLACFKEKKNDNVFIVETKDKETKEVFVKYITLIDFLKFLIGKYKNENLDIMPCEPTTQTIMPMLIVSSIMPRVSLRRKPNFLTALNVMTSLFVKRRTVKSTLPMI